MIDMKLIRTNPELVKENIKKKFQDEKLPLVDEVVELDKQYRETKVKSDALRNQRKTISKAIGGLMAKGQKEEAEAKKAEVAELAKELSESESLETDLEARIRKIMLVIPNIIDDTVPIGRDDSENVEQRRWGEPRHFEWEPKAHWDIGTDLNILDFDAAAKISGARFTVYRGLGARLERAVINFFMDTHAADGYTEVLPPYMVTRSTMTGTGQLPKFEEDAYKLDQDTFLIPTAEVPVTNLYRDMILDGKDLPIRHCAYSACFRKEAGSAGRDTRGLIRQHQFNKVEMVKITKPEQSYEELESMTRQAEKVLQLLGLPYRVVALCSGDLGFSAAKCYDIEVWMPSYNRYVEISSCSNCEDFQARRAGIRYREDPKSKPQLCHTLNGSGVAVGRTVAAILENYQNSDGSVTVPEVLRKYMGVDVIGK